MTIIHGTTGRAQNWLIRLAIAIVIFAVLIAIRNEFDAAWLRVLVHTA